MTNLSHLKTLLELARKADAELYGLNITNPSLFCDALEEAIAAMERDGQDDGTAARECVAKYNALKDDEGVQAQREAAGLD